MPVPFTALSTWDDELKICLMRAVVYYRLIQAEMNPYDRQALLDFQYASPPAAVEDGNERLKKVLERFFLAKDADRYRPYHKKSSFSKDAAILLSELEQEQFVYRTSARPVIIPLGERLLGCHELCLALHTTREQWEGELNAVRPNLSWQSRADQYEVLIRKHWTANTPTSRLIWPREYFVDATKWAKTVGFV